MVQKTLHRYLLHPSVCYRRYEDIIVLYLTSQQKMFTFSGSADDILECFKSWCSVEGAVKKIATEMNTSEIDDLQDVVAEFVKTLVENGILICEYRQTIEDYSLEKEVESRFSESHQLYSVTLELTYHCNERCRHCYVSKKNLPELSAEQIKEVMVDLRKMNVFNLVFTGGELFARTDAFEILEFAHSLGFVIDIFTNGNLIHGEDYIRLKMLWPRSVHFSLYSHIPQKHDAITQITGSFERTLHSAKTCVAIGIPVNIKTPIMTETLDDIRAMAELAQSIGASIELGSNITPKMDGSLQPTELKIMDEAGEKTVWNTIGELFPETENDAPTRERTQKLCGAGDYSLSINPYGEVFPCGMLQLCIGDVTQSSIKDIWEKSEVLAWWREHNLKTHRVGCDDCEHSDRCVFCPGEAMMRTGSPIQKYAEACRSTKAAAGRENRRKEGRCNERKC